MLNYRVQSCIDSDTYTLLSEYMERNGYETTSIAIRKILSEYLNGNSSNCVGDVDCKTVKL